MSATLIVPTDAQIDEIQRIFKLQQQNQFNVGNTTVSQRTRAF